MLDKVEFDLLGVDRAFAFWNWTQDSNRVSKKHFPFVNNHSTDIEKGNKKIH